MSACCCFSFPWILDASCSPRNCCLVHLPNAPPVFSYTWSSLLILDCMEMWEWDYSIPFVFLFLISWKKKYFLGCLMLLFRSSFWSSVCRGLFLLSKSLSVSLPGSSTLWWSWQDSAAGAGPAPASSEQSGRSREPAAGPAAEPLPSATAARTGTYLTFIQCILTANMRHCLSTAIHPLPVREQWCRSTRNAFKHRSNEVKSDVPHVLQRSFPYTETKHLLLGSWIKRIKT